MPCIRLGYGLEVTGDRHQRLKSRYPAETRGGAPSPARRLYVLPYNHPVLTMWLGLIALITRFIWISEPHPTITHAMSVEYRHYTCVLGLCF